MTATMSDPPPSATMAQTQPLLLCLAGIIMAFLSFSLTLSILQHRDYTNTGGLWSLFESLAIWALLYKTSMLAIQLFLHLHFMSTALEHLNEALEAAEDEHKFEKYPGLLGQYPSSILSNGSLSYKASTLPSRFLVPDIHPIDSRFVISYAGDPIDVLKSPCNLIEDPSTRRTASYVPGSISKKATSKETTEWLSALAVSKAPATNLLNPQNLDILGTLAEEEEETHWDDEISSWNLEVVTAQPKGMWLANEHSYDRHFGKGGSWEGYGYYSNDEGYWSREEGKKDRKILRKKNSDEEVKGKRRMRNVLKKREGRRQG